LHGRRVEDVERLLCINQGGVGGVPGTLLPIDSIDELSTQTQGGAESGGNSGTTINAAIKSGTNRIHGTAYYFNRNEFFAAMGPFTIAHNAVLAAAGSFVPKKPPIHFQEWGGSVGGPILKDRMFYFLNYERQQYVLGQGTSSQTEPSAAYVNQALALLASGGVTPATNPTIPMMEKLVTTLWQPSMLTGAATPGNWTAPTSAAQHGYSNNVVMKFDQTLNAKNKVSERWYWGEGKQTVPLSTSQNPWYYQVAGERVDNVAITLNTSLNAKSSNQILMGVDYYNQPFGDADPNNGAASVGFITGLGPGDTYGQPGIQISNFDGTGGTSIQIRNDFSGHLTETYSLSLGKHQIRAGGEYRRTQIFEVATGRGSSSIYTRGTFSFSGSRGFNAPSGANGTSYPGSADPYTTALADYLQGEVALTGSSPGANLYNGILDRNDSENNFNIYGQDNFQVTPHLSLTYGLRWDYLSPVGDDQRDLSTFRPGTPVNLTDDLTGGLAIIGQDISEPYKAFVKQIAPRLGFSWQPTVFPSISRGMVVRGAIGLYFDQPGAGNWLAATSLAGNPAGTRPLYNETLSGADIVPNVSIFPVNAAASVYGQCVGVTTPTCPALSIGAVDPNYSTGDTTNISFSVQKALGPKAVMEISYVGERGRHLSNTLHPNQTTYGATTNTAILNGFSYQQIQRPYFGQYANFGEISETSSFGSSDANAFQAYIRTRNWHGLLSELSYALSTSKGTGSIEDYNNPALDYGSNAVITNQLKGYWTYNIPNFKRGPSWLVNKWITGGWQTTGTIVFHGAAALTASGSGTCNQSSSTGNTYALTCSGLGVGEAGGRADLTGLPRFCPKGNCGGTLTAGVTGTSRSKVTNGFIQWYNPYSVISPPGCSAVVGANKTGADCSKPLTAYYGTTKPGQIHGAPGFGDIDLSIFKNFPITEKVKGQFRGEMFNFLNRYNYKAPSLSANSTAADLRYGGLNHSTTTGEITSTVGGTSAPGITEGEPFNVQLALKVIF
jgi:TonB dependent receptor